MIQGRSACKVCATDGVTVSESVAHRLLLASNMRVRCALATQSGLDSPQIWSATDYRAGSICGESVEAIDDRPVIQVGRRGAGGSNKSFRAINVGSPQAFRRAKGPAYTSLGQRPR